MTEAQLKALNEKITALTELIDSGKKEDRESIKAMRDEVAEMKEAGATINTNVGEIKATLHDHDEWKSALEKKLDNLRWGGGNTGDALKSAIPERMLGMIDRYGRRGSRPALYRAGGGQVDSACDVVQLAAMEAWFKLSILTQTKYGVEHHGQYREEMEKLELAMGGGVQKAAFDEGVAATGGNVVPTPVEALILRVAEDASVVRGLARIMPMTTLTHNLPDDAGGITVAKVAEAAAISQSEPTFGQKALTAEMIAVRGLGSLQVLQDAVIGLVDYWILRASEAYGLYEDAQALEGDGTDFTGLSDATSVNELLATITVGGIDTNGGPIHYEQMSDVIYSGVKRSTRASGRGTAWVMHPKVLSRVVGKTSTTGSPAFNRNDIGRVLSANIVGPGFGEGTIMGYPVWTSDQISITRTKGTLSDASFAYFGPFQDGVIIGDLLGIQFMVSEHVAFNNAQLAFRMLKRVAILVGNPAAMTRYMNIDAS